MLSSNRSLQIECFSDVQTPIVTNLTCNRHVSCLNVGTQQHSWKAVRLVEKHEQSGYQSFPNLLGRENEDKCQHFPEFSVVNIAINFDLRYSCVHIILYEGTWLNLYETCLGRVFFTHGFMFADISNSLNGTILSYPIEMNYENKTQI